MTVPRLVAMVSPEHPYVVTRLGAMLPQVGTPLFVNRPQHGDPTPFHDHDFVEVAVVVGGTAIHQGIHGDHPVSRGDVLFLHPGQWHGYVRCGDVVLYNIGLPPALLLRELAWLLEDPRLAGLLPHASRPSSQRMGRVRVDAAAVPELESHLRRMVELMRDPVRARTELIALAATVLSRIAPFADPIPEMRSEDDAVLSIAARMDADLAHAWGLAELADVTGLSREHLCRRFRVIFGRPPLAWLTWRRAERAAVALLVSEKPVAEVGRLVGWPDPNLCARRFRAAFGCSPSEWRQRAPPVLVS